MHQWKDRREGERAMKGMSKMNGTTLEKIVERVKNEKVRITIDITPNEDGTVIEHWEVEPWEPFEMRCPYGK